jgi:hypothetical protein
MSAPPASSPPQPRSEPESRAEHAPRTEPVPTLLSLVPPSPFSLSHCTRLFTSLSATDTAAVPFVAAVVELKSVLAGLGTVLGFASAEISSNCASLLSRLAEARASATPPRETLQALLADELARKRATAKHSVARELFRTLWLLDFVAALLTAFANSPDASLKEIAKGAYGETLSAHHSSFVRNCVAAALLLLPTKAGFAATLNGDGCAEASLAAHVRDFVASFAPLRASLWRLFKEHKLDDGRLE